MTYDTAEVWNQIEESGKAAYYHESPVAFRIQLLKEAADYGVRLNVATHWPRGTYPRLYVYLTGARR
jgi:hypothetical protein